MGGYRTALAAVLLVAACGGNPFVEPVDPVDPVDPGTGGGATGNDGGTIDEKVAKDLNSVSYDGSLSVDLTGLISSAKETPFVRAATLDIVSAGAGQPDYRAFIYQETAVQRSYLAFVATNQRGNLVATSVADGGQFNEHNAGGNYYRTGSYTKPIITAGIENGLFAYMGSYAGIFVPGPTTDFVRPPGLRPGSPLRVTGTMQVNASFQDDMIEGGVVDRAIWDDAGNQITQLVLTSGTIDLTDPDNLPDIVLRENVIDADGRFLGDVEYLGSPNNPVGNYGGLFGGLQGSDVAGVLWLHPIPGQNGIWEYGTFNLPRCDMAGASPLCSPR